MLIQQELNLDHPESGRGRARAARASGHVPGRFGGESRSRSSCPAEDAGHCRCRGEEQGHDPHPGKDVTPVTVTSTEAHPPCPSLPPTMPEDKLAPRALRLRRLGVPLVCTHRQCSGEGAPGGVRWGYSSGGEAGAAGVAGAAGAGRKGCRWPHSLAPVTGSADREGVGGPRTAGGSREQAPAEQPARAAGGEPCPLSCAVMAKATGLAHGCGSECLRRRERGNEFCELNIFLLLFFSVRDKIRMYQTGHGSI